MEEQMKIAAMMSAAVLVVVTPGQAELPAVLAVYEALKDTGRKVPMVFVNARLVQDVGAAAGALLNNYRNMERLLLPVFHLEQYEPPEDKELIPLNPAVITRVWPRPFSVWEDNPDDPDSIEGYFLLDVNDVRAPNGDDMVAFLTMSRKATKDLRNRERETREKGRRATGAQHARAAFGNAQCMNGWKAPFSGSMKEPAAMAFRPPHVGDKVQVYGIRSRPELNGAVARVVSRSVDGAGRVAVQLFPAGDQAEGEGCEASPFRPVKIRLSSLRQLSTSSSVPALPSLATEEFQRDSGGR
ncbi:unnamed protein product [Polarella glacialis]|uniref:Uncharacterized protein n=1 Tax=Polarella glacialis TaxID=89957 RepID=A0A813EDS2_POLGL|nr:unnamed protein product [Polarella glacialis]